MPDDDPKPVPPPPPPPPPDDPPPPPPPHQSVSNRPMIDALFCAINVLRVTAGFSRHEQANAADVLEVELRRLRSIEGD